MLQRFTSNRTFQWQKQKILVFPLTQELILQSRYDCELLPAESCVLKIDTLPVAVAVTQ